MDKELAKRVAKLPIWARQLVIDLDADLTRAQQEIRVYEKNAVPSNTTLDPKLAKISLGDGAVVRFDLPAGPVDAYISNAGDRLLIRSGLGTQLNMHPLTSHGLRLTLSLYERMPKN